MLAIGTVFVSKGAYDLIFASSRHVFIRIILFVLFPAVAVGSAAVFNAVLNKILTHRHKYRSREVLISQCVLSLAGLFMVLLIFRLTVLNDYFSLPSKRAAIVKNQELKVDRNAVVIVVDCLCADHLGSYGYDRQTSPFLNQPGRSGVRFENCIAAVPVPYHLWFLILQGFICSNMV